MNLLIFQVIRGKLPKWTFAKYYLSDQMIEMDNWRSINSHNATL